MWETNTVIRFYCRLPIVGLLLCISGQGTHLNTYQNGNIVHTSFLLPGTLYCSLALQVNTMLSPARIHKIYDGSEQWGQLCLRKKENKKKKLFSTIFVIENLYTEHKSFPFNVLY